MKPTSKLWCVVLVLSVLTIGGTSVVLEARAQGQRSGVCWEYAWVDLPADGIPMFASAERATAMPPTRDRVARESVEQMLQRNSAAALDAAGQQGWEAIGIVPTREGVKVLLKRPR